MTETPTKPRTRKLKHDKPLTEAEEAEVKEFDNSRTHYFTHESTKDVPEGGVAVNAVTYCGLVMTVNITRKPLRPSSLCPICAMAVAEQNGVLGKE